MSDERLGGEGGGRWEHSKIMVLCRSDLGLNVLMRTKCRS